MAFFFDLRAKIVCLFNTIMAGSRCGDASYTNKAAFDAVTHPGMNELEIFCMSVSNFVGLSYNIKKNQLTYHQLNYQAMTYNLILERDRCFF